MSDWNEVYRQKDADMATAAEVVLENTRLLSAQGKALDYASGLAGNGFYLSSKGYEVTAWDLSSVAVEKINARAEKNGAKLHAEMKDLEKAIPAMYGQFDVIAVSYFLHRESLRHLYEYLKKDGLLFYQTFSGRQLNGTGPSREAFRLQRGELLNVYSDMQLLYYREDNSRSACKPDQVYFVAMK
ncbi:hypothetical protein MNBD_GAMMA11-1193 [hydrothermal vent metagenome]|uniref:Tellurite resistance methyltransferase TehB-like domain-containing protein n=1 Tax=hydrothermal vent metagenome TaxID=652676 RepID=A0A3B0WYT4_9ZZZZ